MFSERKILIRIAELGALLGSVGCFLTVAAVESKSVTPAQVAPFVFAEFVLAMLVAAATVALAAEFAKLRRLPAADPFRGIQIPWSEMKHLLKWCPLPTMLCWVAALFVAAYTLYKVGISVQWSSDQPFTHREAIGFPLFTSILLLFAAPVLASASRMPGSYAVHFHPMLRKNAA